MRLYDISQLVLSPAVTSQRNRFGLMLCSTSADFGKAYGPDSLSAIQTAFDQAWLVVGGNYAPADIESARQRLAQSLLSVAEEHCRDVERLKREALQAMALSYHQTPRDTQSGYVGRLGEAHWKW